MSIKKNPAPTRDSADRLATILEKGRAIGPTLRARAPEADRAARLSDETIADLDSTGAFNIASPAEFGGDELSVREQLDVLIEVSKWDGSCGWVVWAGASINWILAGSGSCVLEEVFAPEWVDHASRDRASRGRARRVEDGWIITGGPWTFATASLWAPFTNLGCLAEDASGTYMVAVQAPRDELNFLDDWHVAGMRGTGSVSVTLKSDEFLVPDYRVVDFRQITSGAIESGLAGSLWKAPTLGWSFSLMAGISIGIAQGALVYAKCHASPARPGACSTRVLVDDENILLLPDKLNSIQAAAIGNSGVAAYMPLVETAGIRPGDNVLILGATGAVGQIAVQIAKAKGAALVVGVGRDRAVLEHLKSLGADAVVELRTGAEAVELTARLRDMTTGGVNVILDGLYGMSLEAALPVCASQARVVNIGHSAGATASIPAGILRGKQLALFGFAGLHTPLKDKQPVLSWLWAALKEGTLRVNVETVLLEDLPEALRAQATSPHAKIVVLPSQTRESRR